MRPSLLIQSVSPSVGYLSPPTDTGDASSDDGDTLQTPLTEHDEHQPCSVYQQEQHSPYSEHMFAYDPHHEHVNFSNVAKHSILQPLSPLTPLASERIAHVQPNDDPFFSSPTPYAVPSRALDLANASLEINPFAVSFAASFSKHVLDPDAPPFTPTKQTFDALPTFSSSPPHEPCVPGTSHLYPIPSLSINDLCDSEVDMPMDTTSLLLECPPFPHAVPVDVLHMPHCGRTYSPRFPLEHTLNPFFVRTYALGDELGAGGYGFVMTARNISTGNEVAVKFIIKDKVPDHAWWEDDMFGRVPTEVMLMSLVNHENIVKCLDLFEDEIYFYLVQELHGTPWVSRKRKPRQVSAPGKLAFPTPTLTPSASSESATMIVDSMPPTPLQVSVENIDVRTLDQDILPGSSSSGAELEDFNEEDMVFAPAPTTDAPDLSEELYSQKNVTFLEPPSSQHIRPNFTRRPSHDLFECIEQSKHKRLSENQARYIFAQVVEAVHYLNTQGITHCDIKDENLVIDSDLKVKLIDFGSAVVADPSAPRPFYTLFFGTTAYAASEILRKQPYQAAPAEVWTLGVLLSYLLTGHSPFPTEQDAIDGRIVLRGPGSTRLSRAALALVGRCLERDPERRADVDEVRGHRWLSGALEKAVAE